MIQLPPACPGMPEGEIDTPALVLDLDALEANLDLMAALIEPTGARLRPHAKTHKSTVIAHQQIRRGAIGQCVQKVAEAEALAWGGVGSIMVTNQVVDAGKLRRLAALAPIAEVFVCADHPTQIDTIEAVAEAAGIRMPVLVEIDAGAHRCGVAPGDSAVPLARRIAASRHLRFAGLQAYHGGAQHVRDAEERRAAAQSAVEASARTIEAVRGAGLGCEIVAGAGTGTFEIEAHSGVYTEIQAGSYCFLDVDYALNLNESGRNVSRFQHALFVLSTVISTSRPGQAVLDTGHKSVAVDRGLPSVWQQPDLRLTGASDEHLRMEGPAARMPAIGEKFRLIPGHCDPTVDRFDWYVGVRKGRVESVWPVSARGGTY